MYGQRKKPHLISFGGSSSKIGLDKIAGPCQDLNLGQQGAIGRSNPILRITFSSGKMRPACQPGTAINTTYREIRCCCRNIVVPLECARRNAISLAKTRTSPLGRSARDSPSHNSISRPSTNMVQINADIVAATAAALNFTQVLLTPPLNWIAGTSLFPSQIIAGYNADVSEYTAEEWSAYMLDACQGFTACTSVDGFQGMFSAHYLEALEPDHHLPMLTAWNSDKQRQHWWTLLVWICISRRCYG